MLLIESRLPPLAVWPDPCCNGHNGGHEVFRNEQGPKRDIASGQMADDASGEACPKAAWWNDPPAFGRWAGIVSWRSREPGALTTLSMREWVRFHQHTDRFGVAR